MSRAFWTEEEENCLRDLYSKDCMIIDFTSEFNKRMKTHRSKQALINKAHQLGLDKDFIGGSRYNHIKILTDRAERTGQVNQSNDGELMKIIQYNDVYHVLVEFQDEFKFQVWAEYGNFKKGTVKNPGHKQLYGRGYLGVGPYKPWIKKGEKTKAHDAWIRMFDRCYSDKFHENWPTYIGCEVCEEWYNFQNFAKWFYDNYYEVPNQSMEVDKDWLVVNNKIYCPDNCCIAPNIINTCTLSHDKVINFNMPIGISWHKNGSYVARCSNRGKRKTIGYYHNIEDASKAYWTYKINYVEDLAREYKSQIPDKLYDAMMNFRNTYKQRYGLEDNKEGDI